VVDRTRSPVTGKPAGAEKQSPVAGKQDDRATGTHFREAHIWPAVRLVQITIPVGKRDAVLETLEAEGVDYVLTEEVSGRDYGAIATFPLPTSAVEPVLEELRAVGIDEEAYTIILEANTVISKRFEVLQEEYDDDEETSPDRIAREELAAAAGSLVPSKGNYVVMTIVSALVATAGLLLNSPSVVVGSMVIAPLVGPALAASVGTVLDDAELRVQGVVLQVAGVALAVASAAAFALFVQVTHLVPPGLDLLENEQIRERLAPDFLSLAIALGAGVAGAISLSTGVPVSLVGVMIAVALIPPAAVVGIGIAWWIPPLAIGASVLLAVNILSINLSALAVLWFQGYRPKAWFRERDVMTATITRIGVLALVILVFSTFLGGVTYASYQGAVAEEAIREEVDAVLAEHENLTLLDATVRIEQDPLSGSPERVVVTIGKPSDYEHPKLAGELRSRIEQRTGTTVDVQVRLVEFQKTDDSEAIQPS